MNNKFTILKVLSVIFIASVGAWLWHVSPYVFFAGVYLYIGDMLKDYIHWSMNGNWGQRVLVHLFWPFWLVAFVVVGLYRGVKGQWNH